MTVHTQTTHAHKAHQHNLPLLLFFVGVFLFITSLFLTEKSVAQNSMLTLSMLLTGYHIIEEGVLETIQHTREKGRFSPNVHILMALAAIGAAIIGDFMEGALLILIFASSHFLEDYAQGKSKREITKLMKLNPTEARLLDEAGNSQVVPVTQIEIGDKLQVLNGDQVATDGVIISGISTLDESAITGESLPVEKSVGDDVFGSTMNGTGQFVMEVTKETSETLFAQIIKLVNESQHNQSQTATKIQKLEPKYVITVLILVPLFILLGGTVIGWSWYESFYRGMVFLTVASPCALAASAVPASLSAISNLARKGVLFKGGAYLSYMSELKAVAFDKTGTLTRGKPEVTDTYFIENVSQQHLLAIVVAMEKQANHPLSQAIVEAFDHQESFDLTVENNIGKGLRTVFEKKEYQIGKPSDFKNVPKEVMEQQTRLSEQGKTVVFISQEQQVVGLIALMDVPNPSAKNVIKYLKKQKIQTVMLTGDAVKTGEAVGKMIGIDEVMGNILPENKAQKIKELKAKYGTVAMLGDGVNDAPALVEASIGVAMGEGTDIAMDVADAVLMKNDLTRFSYAHKVAKKLDRVIWQNIWFALVVIVFLVILNFLGKMNLPIGVVFHEGSTVLVILNGLRLLIPIKE